MTERLWMDTNVVLRYLLNDHEEHSAAARVLIERAEKGEADLLVPSFVVCEAVFVLESKSYTRQEIHDALARFLAIPGINSDNPSAVQLALVWHRDKSVDFVDALLYAFCSTDDGQVATFNKRHFGRLGDQWKEP